MSSINRWGPRAARTSSLAFAMLGASLAPAFAAEIADAADQPITVDGVDVNAQKPVDSPKFTVPLRDTPKSVTIIPSEIIQSTGSASLVEALRTVPGITFGAGEGGNPLGDRPFLRGYDTQSSTFVDGLRDIGSQSREVFNVESIEVIKGASGAYVGRGGAGGGIYIVSKTPQQSSFTNVSASVGTDNYYRGTVDTNMVLGDGIALRITAMGHDADVAGRDEVHYSRWGIAPSLAFGLGTDTRVILSYYHLQSDDLPDSGIPYNNPSALPTPAQTGTPRVFFPGDGSPVSVNRSTFYGLTGRDFRKDQADMGTVRFEHDFGGGLHLRNTTRYAETKQDYIVTQPDDSKGNIYYDRVWRRPNTRVSDVNYLINQTDLYGTFNTGSIKHNFAAGLELSREEGENDSYSVFGAVGGGLSATYSPCNAASMATFNCTSLTNPNPNDAWTGYAVRNNNPTNSRTTTKALYAFDTITLNEQWQLNVGLRYDNYSARFTSAIDTAATVGSPPAPNPNFGKRSTFRRKDDLFNYQLGVVYKPIETASIYLSYGTSATPAGNALAQGSDGNALSNAVNANLSPEKNRTLELGAKWDLLEGRLSLTSAIFRVETTNARVALDSSGVVALAGEKRVDGFEIGLSGSITDKWDVFAGYTYLDAKIVDGGFRANPIPGGPNLPALSTGAPFPNTPKNSFSLWTTYEVLPQLTIGGGAYYVDKVFGSSTTDPNAQKWVPDYWRLDATASYRFNDKLDLQLNIQNLTDETYFNQAYPTHYAGVAPGRSAVLTLNAKF